MARQHGIKVTMVRLADKQPYREYTSPQKTPGGHRKSKITYVEAVSGERFAVVVEILPGFDFMSSSHVQISASIDEKVQSNWPISAKEVATSTGATSVEDRQVTWDKEERFVDGKWKSYALTFAKIQINEAAVPTDERIRRHIKAQGRICVTIIRGTRVDCDPYVDQSVEKITEPLKSSRDVVEKHHVSHTTKLVQLEECEPLLNTFKFKRAKGVAGVPIKFVFRGRSKNSLQLLKMMPNTLFRHRVTSPPPKIFEQYTAAGAQNGTVRARQDDEDDDEEPTHEKTKTKMTAGDQTSMSSVKRQHTAAQPTTAAKSERNSSLAASVAPAKQLSAQPSTDGRNIKSEPIVIKDEDEDSQTAEPRQQPQVQPSKAHSQRSVPATAADRNGQAERERTKEILKNRLEQLKIEQKLLELGN